ncbi:MAG: hypothetical protein JNJ57_21255 [Saprospiraceae bacterium]|nr:hypothetical protein [Saprospiraceae bacterium]
MSYLLIGFTGLPVAAFLMTPLIPRNHEKTLSGLLLTTLGLNLILALVFCGWWAFSGAPILTEKLITLYQTQGFEFFISLYFDLNSAVFLLVGAILMLLISIFSKYYMHRDPGYRRFFSTMLLFYSGYNLIVTAGNFETLFIGWEIIGIT